MPLTHFNVHFIRVVNPDNPNIRDYKRQCISVEAYRPQDAEQAVREDVLRQGHGFIRGKVKIDLREAYAKRGRK